MIYKNETDNIPDLMSLQSTEIGQVHSPSQKKKKKNYDTRQNEIP